MTGRQGDLKIGREKVRREKKRHEVISLLVPMESQVKLITVIILFTQFKKIHL